MDRQTFPVSGSANHTHSENPRTERLIIIALLLAGILVFTINLGGLSLRDWDEGTVAQVAREIFTAPPDSNRWLFPTLWGEPYLNKPPLVHDLIAVCYFVGGVNEEMARLPSALLMAISVPLLYCLGKELFTTRQQALLSTLIYLTTLPVVRHGRLAMLDGTVICFSILLMWSAVRSRRDLRWCLSVGISIAFIGLTKGMMAILLASIAFGFLAWDRPRLLRSVYFGEGIILGCLPLCAWYGLQWIHYRDQFVETAVLSQSLARIWHSVGDHSGPPWYYLQRLLHSLPWLIFALHGLRLAWHNRNWSWGKLIIVWSGVSFLAVSLMSTKLPWYILPIYPALALAGGAMLSEVLHSPFQKFYPRHWGIMLLILALVAVSASVYFGFTEQGSHELVVIFLGVALTTGIGGGLILHRDQKFIHVLSCGMYISLVLFVSSSHWNWELNETYPVKPVAHLIQDIVPKTAPVYTSFAYQRPSLNFYAQRQVIPATNQELKNYWQKQPSVHLLVDRQTFKQLQLQEGEFEEYQAPPNWNLIRHSQ